MAALFDRLRSQGPSEGTAARTLPGSPASQAPDHAWQELKSRIHNALFDHLDLSRIGNLSEEQVKQDVSQATRALLDEEKALLTTKKRFFSIDFENQGGLIMPILLEIEYASGKKEEVRIPAEIWRSNSERVSKLIVADEAIVAVTLDPHLETADVDLSDNHWPPEIPKTRFEVFKREKRKNPMQQAADPAKDAKAHEEKKDRDKESDARRDERRGARGK